MTEAVLICDDSALARKQLQKQLPAQLATNVEFAKDGLDALTRMRNHKFKVVFLDLTMPEMDGVAVLQHNQKEALCDKIIVVSADIQPAMQDKVHQLGALAFVKKPISNDHLVDILKEHGIHD
ncbi:response regulator [Gayadomonas joobiniege]|uniref:response regulator n=1 Tax=Gayadomonas joobiniege TaxID=1234606 RepID=UPI0003746EC1|nr:response regulator [Gayadomonas joobiniege]